MWEHPATQANLALLRERGVTVIDPGDRRAGDQARVGHRAPGRAAPISLAAVEAVVAAARRAPGTACKVLVTAGGTREPIDAVRYVGNRSLGPHGLRAGRGGRRARRRGDRHRRQRRARAPRRACATSTSRPRPSCRTPASAEFAGRRRPADGRRRRRLPARRAPSTASSRRTGRDELDARARAYRRTCSPGWPPPAAPSQTLVGFAAEHGDGRGRLRPRQAGPQGPGRRRGQRRRARGIGFDAADNEVTIVTAAGERHVPRATKAEIARAILATVDACARRAGPRPRGTSTMQHRGATVDGAEVAARRAARAADRRGGHGRRRGPPARCWTGSAGLHRSPRATS